MLAPGTRIQFMDDEDHSVLCAGTILEYEENGWYEITQDGIDDDTPWIHEDLIVGVLSDHPERNSQVAEPFRGLLNAISGGVR